MFVFCEQFVKQGPRRVYVVRVHVCLSARETVVCAPPRVPRYPVARRSPACTRDRERDLYTLGAKIDDPRGKHNAIHTAKNTIYGKKTTAKALRSSLYCKNTAKAAKGQNTAKTAGKMCNEKKVPWWAKMDLGGQKC